jgi:hypothetical protein
MRGLSYPHILAGACSIFLSPAAQADPIAPLAFTTQVQSSRVIQGADDPSYAYPLQLCTGGVPSHHWPRYRCLRFREPREPWRLFEARSRPLAAPPFSLSRFL